jgi:hypothetical protein
VKTRSILILVVAACPLIATAGGPADDPFANLNEMDANALDDSRGADSNTVIVTSQQDFNAAVHGSEFNVGAMNNGDINLGNGAFDNFNGIGVNVLNTGNSNGFSVGVGVSVYLQ